VVDKPRNVAANIRVTREQAVNSETPNLSTPKIFVFTKNAISAPYFLARIMNNPFILVDIFSCINTPTMQLRPTSFEFWKIQSSRKRF
jgi:hypothetical protein